MFPPRGADPVPRPMGSRLAGLRAVAGIGGVSVMRAIGEILDVLLDGRPDLDDAIRCPGLLANRRSSASLSNAKAPGWDPGLSRSLARSVNPSPSGDPRQPCRGGQSSVFRIYQRAHSVNRVRSEPLRSPSAFSGEGSTP